MIQLVHRIPVAYQNSKKKVLSLSSLLLMTADMPNQPSTFKYKVVPNLKYKKPWQTITDHKCIVLEAGSGVLEITGLSSKNPKRKIWLPQGCSITIPYQYYQNNNISLLGSSNSTECPLTVWEAFKIACIRESIDRGKLSWRFTQTNIKNPHDFNALLLEKSGILFEDLYDPSNPIMVQSQLEAFVNNRIASSRKYSSPERERAYQTFFKALWKLLYNENAVGLKTDMAKKILTACNHLDIGATYQETQQMLKKEFGSAGEGPVMTIAQLLLGNQVTIKDPKGLLEFIPMFANLGPPAAISKNPTKEKLDKKKEEPKNLTLSNLFYSRLFYSRTHPENCASLKEKEIKKLPPLQSNMIDKEIAINIIGMQADALKEEIDESIRKLKEDIDRKTLAAQGAIRSMKT